MSDRLSELMEREPGWPSAGDKIFVHAGARGAQIDNHPDFRRHHMLGGYKLAAMLLADAAGKHLSRKLIYPTMFCYRHALELTLKQLLDRHGAAAGEPPNRQDHHLEKLWASVRRVLEHYGIPSTELETVDAVEECIAEISKIDVRSFTFRYPTDKKGEPIPLSFWPSLEQIQSTMRSIFEFFECVEMHLSACDQHTSDMIGGVRGYC